MSLEFRGKQYDVITLDFETYFAKDYTLSAMPSSAYVRDKRFLAQMVGIKKNDGPTQIYIYDDIKPALDAIDWKNSLLMAHNTAFDGFILTQRYKHKPAGYLDTLSMARAVLGHSVSHRLDNVGRLLGLGGKADAASLAEAKGMRELPDFLLERMAKYCARDVDLCHAVFGAMYNHFPDDELELVDLTLRMFCEPTFRLDKALIQEELDEEIAGKMRGLMLTGVQRADLMSSEKFAALLLRAGAGNIPLKVSPTTGKSTYAFAKTDAGMQALLVHPTEAVRNLANARLTLKSTIGETRAQRFLDAAHTRAKTMPVLLNYYGAHTGRWSGGDKMNMQNLPRNNKDDPTAGRLRRSLLAPKGKMIVVADSGQIEARVNAWMAQQHDVLETFRKYDAGLGPDVYVVMASKLFSKPIGEVTKHERFIGKIVVLALGYGMGPNKLVDTLANAKPTPVHISLDTAAEWVEIYRRENNKIQRSWRQYQSFLPAMTRPTCQITLGPLTFVHEAVRLPSGLFIRYPELQVSPGPWENAIGEASFKGRLARNKLYGGLLCIAEGTGVLSERGWIRIEDVRADDRIHDGVEFVSHGGLLFKSVQECVNVDGVEMTGGHEVLTDEGWKTALEKPEPYRPHIRGLDRRWPDWIEWEKDELGVPVPVRSNDDQGRHRGYQSSETGAYTELRVSDQSCPVCGKVSRNESSPSLCCVSIDDRSMPPTHAPSLEKLRGARDYSVQALGYIRGVLGGHGSDIQSETNAGSNEQQQRVLAEQLQVGDDEDADAKQAKQSISRRSGDVREIRGAQVDDLLSTGTRARPVYDIVNCGPRRRFVVAGYEGPFIVHNCENFVQALSRCIIAEQMLTLAREGIRIITTTHDEIVALASTSKAEKTYRRMIEVMSTPPIWAPDLPLAAEGGYAENYSK